MIYTRNKKFQMLKIAQRADRLLRSRWLNVVPLFILLSICCLLGAILYLMDVSRQVERNAVLSKDALWVEQALRFELSAIQERARAFNDAAFNQNTLSREDKVHQFARTNSAVVDVSFANDEELLSNAIRGTASSNPKLEARALAARLSKVSDQATTTDPYDDVDRAGESIVDLIIPLRSTESKANLLLVSISLQRFLDIQVPWWISQRYGVSLTTTGGNVVAAKDHLPAADVEEEYRISFDPPLRNMYLSLQLRRAAVGFSGIILVAGFIGSGLFSMALVIATYFHLQNRIAAERRLAEAHAFRKAMEDSITIGMRARDLSGRIIYANTAFYKMIGWNESEILGSSPPMKYWDPETFGQTDQLNEKLLNGRADIQGHELTFVKKCGAKFPVLLYEAPLIDAEGTQIGWMGSVLDISERKKLEDEKRSRNEQMQHNARLISMGEMASSLAHELNQPLTAIAGYSAAGLNIAQSRTACLDDMREIFEKTSLCAQHAGRVISRIKDYVQRRDPVMAVADLNESINRAMEFIRPEAVRAGVKIDVISRDVTSIARIDVTMMTQVLINLLRNSMDASAGVPGGHISVVVTRDQSSGGLIVSVQDNGSGVPDLIVGNLFEPFRSTKAHGMGLGLSICRSIVELHGGRIWYQKREMRGASFIFKLPEVGEC